MDNILKALILGASVLLVIGVISISIVLFNSGQEIVKKSEQDMADISQAISMKKFENYNNTVVSGSQVINVIRMYSENANINVIVTTGSGTTVTYNSTNKYSITDPTDARYINPTGKFISTITVNANKVVTAINFQQQ